MLHPHRQDIHARLLTAIRATAGRSAEELETIASFAAAALAQTRTVVVAGVAPEAFAAQALQLWDFLSAADLSSVSLKVLPEDGGVRVLSVVKDQPFIVDTLRLGLRQLNATRISGVSVVLRVEQGASGWKLASEGEGAAVSLVSFFVKGVDGAQAEAAQADITGRLTLAKAMVQDHTAMMERVEAAAEGAFDVGGEDAIEAAEFLRWLLSDNFVFMGVTSLKEGGEEGEALGFDSVSGSSLWGAAALQARAPLLVVRKSSVESPVHRAGRIDQIQINLASGPVVVRGLFTHRALTQPCRHLPVLRRVLAQVLAASKQRPMSYRYRGLANMFDSLPTEWLFSASVEQVADVLERVFEAEEERAVRVHFMQQDGGETTFALIAIPERRYSDAVRARVLDELTRVTGATYTDSSLFAGRFDSALLQVLQTGTRALTDLDREQLQRFVDEISTPWAERMEPALSARFGDAAPALLARYGDAFPAEYTEITQGAEAATDIAFLEEARKSGQVTARVHVESGDVYLSVYQDKDVFLTTLLPVLDNFGLVIKDAVAYEVKLDGQVLHIDSLRLGEGGIAPLLVLERAEKLVAGLQAVFGGHISSDAFNRLILAANLSWQEVDLVRAYVGYARQLGLRQSIPRTQEILLNQSETVAAAIQYFHARFNPALDGDRAAAMEATSSALSERLRAIRTNDEDTVLRTLANLIESSLRTNFYRTDRVCHYISFKIDHAKVKQMPLPRMMVEIYVHHREVEGVHLRGGPVARGGLRFSDRADFRTEVLGLVSTQMVKNVVIVPEGSKGGFYIKYTIDNPAERRRKGDELYQILIRGMLDVTDNIVGGAIVRPPNVVPHDGNDPYLVVAADKGTAHLSDTANRLSLAYGFWLGDAFASGGSNGYDHKAVGITARGGWVLVKRHFREMGMDADRDLFTCVGVGDCAGDVFGNGVIETRKMRLQGAFNHVHIFLDPNPDAETSYEERLRLFNEVKGWEHYNKALISAGGGVFDRKAKSIPLSPEVKAMLGTLADELTPDQVISLILKMPVDLLWNGGIGTYVRATWETNADANDPPNDDLRVTAADLRCKIVGEGGNLGFTQAARVEYALNGGRLNTDFVDNSGGVDTSDHEVNLKILLNPMVASGRITEQERNDFLRSLTDEVAGAVLDDSNANGRLISLDVVRSKRDPFPFGRAIDWLCNRGNISRQRLVLPGEQELRRRASLNLGLTRPELSIIQAHVKMHVRKMLAQEDVSTIPGFDKILLSYFPAAVQQRFGADIPGHMLAKSIGMTTVLTRVATDAGASFFPIFLDLTGASAGRLAGAWLAAMELVDGEALKAELVASKMPAANAYDTWITFTVGLTNLVAAWLSPGSRGYLGEDKARFQAALSAIAASRGAADAAATAQIVDACVAKGLNAATAERLVNSADAVLASEVCAIADARGETIEAAARRYLAVGQASHLLATTRAIGQRKGEGRWDPVALGILQLRYQSLLRELALSTESISELSLGVDRAAETYAASARIGAVARVLSQVVGENADVAALLVGEQQIRAVLA